MSSKPESQLWYKLRDGTKDLGVFWTRLESWASPGVPDLHGIVQGHPFWLELKVHLELLNTVRLDRYHQSYSIYKIVPSQGGRPQISSYHRG